VIELGAANVAAYLRERGVVPTGVEPDAEELGWGISNVVLKVSWPGNCVVVKQSLAELRVGDEWPFDRSRIVGERDCMEELGRLLPDGSVPRVRFSDDESFVLAMSCAPPGGVLWKEALLEGRIEPRAGWMAGALLARIHREAATDPGARERFADQTPLVQGRIDPYHLTAAERHPDLAPIVHREVERLLSTQLTLVLGDYCPKNTFVYPDHVFVLDFEVAHWGDPAFDVAFCLCHLVLKAARFPDRGSAYLRVARSFRDAYRRDNAFDLDRLEAAAARELGCLLLARIDGKSKVEYLSDEPTKDFVRELAREILLGDEGRLSPILDRIERRVAGLAAIGR
jgi:Phosphotransferase enzyme family